MRSNNVIGIIVTMAIFIIIGVAIWNNNKSNNSNSDDDQGAIVDHNGSVETAISVEHADSAHDIILTSHKVWIKNNA